MRSGDSAGHAGAGGNVQGSAGSENAEGGAAAQSGDVATAGLSGASAGSETVAGSAGSAPTAGTGTGGSFPTAGAGTGGSAGTGGLPTGCSSGKGVPLSSSPTLYATGFESKQLTPFYECTTTRPNIAEAATLSGEPSARLYWQQAGYDGTRLKRGAEACSALSFYKEGWYGMQFYLPTPGLPQDKTLGIAQIFSNGGCSSWAAMLQLHSNELWIEHRGNCASPAEYQTRLASNLPHNTWLPIVIHFVASHMSAGTIEIWFGDAVCSPSKPTYRNTGINFGFGDWTGDSLTNAKNNEIGLKFGMYNFDDGNYTAGETRTIYYDNVSQLIGNPADAFATVKPMR